MTSNLSVRSQADPSQTPPVASFSDESDDIAALASKAFVQIERCFSVLAGVPKKCSKEITDLSRSLFNGSYPLSMRPSLFDQNGLSTLDPKFKEHLRLLLRTHSYLSELPIFLAVSIHLLHQLKGLAKENLSLPVREVSANFSHFVFGLMLHMDAKADVEKKVLSEHPAAAVCLKALQSPNLSLSPQTFVDGVMSLSSDISKAKNSPLKKELLSLVDLLIVLVNIKGNDATLYFTELKSFKECTIQSTSVADLLPLVSVFHDVLKTLRYTVTMSDYLDIHRKPLASLDKAISELAKIKLDDTLYIAIIKDISKAYVDHCLVSAPQLNFFLQYKYKQLEAETLNLKGIVNAYTHESTCKHFIYVVEKVGEFLGEHHKNKTFHLLSRMGAIFIHFYGLSCIDMQYEFKTSLSGLHDIVQNIYNLALFNISDAEYKQLMSDYLEMFDIKHLMPELGCYFKGFFENVFDHDAESSSNRDKEAEKITYKKSMKFFSIIPSVLCFFRFKLFERADFAALDSKLKHVHENLTSLLARIPSEDKTLELQQSIRDCFTDCLRKIIFECLLYEDMRRLYVGVDDKDIDLFPLSLLQLVFFDIPGLEQPVIDEPEVCVDVFENIQEIHVEAPTEAVKAVITSSGNDDAGPDKTHELQTLTAQACKVKKAVEIATNKHKKIDEKKSVEYLPTHEDFSRAKKYRQMKKLLKMFDLSQLRTKGSHESYGGENAPFTVLPRHAKDLKIGTRLAIWKQITKSSV